MHHGISGQRWGIRRFQTKNGTLTPEGKERYRQMTKDRKREREERYNDKSQYWDEWNRIENYSKYWDEKRYGDKIRSEFTKKEMADYNRKLMDRFNDWADWDGQFDEAFSHIKKLPEEQQLFALTSLWYDWYEDYLPFDLEERMGTAH